MACASLFRLPRRTDVSPIGQHGGEPFRGAGHKTPGQALRRAGRSRNLIWRLVEAHWRTVCDRDNLWSTTLGYARPRLRHRMLHRQLGEAEEFVAWKDNDQRVPEIDFAPDFELSHG
jgi:hypothetical protein